MVWSPLLDSHWTPVLHALVLSLHDHSSTLDIAFRIITDYTRYYYFMYKCHCYADTDTRDTIIACSWITVIYIPVYMHCLCLYSCHIDHRSYCMYYCCMYLPVCPLHEYFPLLILIFPLLDIWAVDMRCVASHIYCFPFPVVLFYAINKAHVLFSYYLYHALF